jgi:hypothetical protein
MLGTEELYSAAVWIYNGNMGGLTVLATMIICKSGGGFHVTRVYIGYYAASLIA